MFAKKRQHALPRIFSGIVIVNVGTIFAAKGMFGVGVDFHVMRNAILIQRHVELLAGFGGEIFAGIGANDGAEPL